MKEKIHPNYGKCIVRCSIMKEMRFHRYASWQMKSALICIP